MKRVFRLGLVGRDIGHSLSPQLHHWALRHGGLEGRYDLFDCPTSAAVQVVLDRLCAGELDGVNVTTPWKAWATAAARHHWLDGERLSGPPPFPANTLWLHRGQLCAAGTDGPGLVDVMRSEGGELAGRRVAILGGGGAARAIASELGRHGPQRLVLAVREPPRVRSELGVLEAAVEVASWGDAEPLREVDLVVHATRLGHGASGAAVDCRFDEWAWLPFADWRRRGAWLFDVVYARGATHFEAAALAAGMGGRPIARGGPRPQPSGGGVFLGAGLAMLCAQAARSFALFTGRNVDPASMAQGALDG